MRKLFILGNWKTYMVSMNSHQWLMAGLELKEAMRKREQEQQRECVAIICPPFHKLHEMREAITKLEAQDFIKLGVQDLSAFAPGAHTGDEAAETLKKEFGIEYAIIGHSERRREHEESESGLAQKISLALQNSIEPIFCVQNEQNEIPIGVHIVAYEPPYAISAISGGIAEKPEATQKVANNMREKLAKHFPSNAEQTYLLYGGSVNPDNIASFTNNPALSRNFDGALVGAKSLTPEFFQIIHNA